MSRFRERLAARRDRWRVALANANRLPVAIVSRPRLRTVVVARRATFRPRVTLLQQLEDRRTFHPERAARPARGFFMPRHRLVAVAPTVTFGSVPDTFSPVVPVGVGFAAPRQVAVCVRRRVRREVMHAKGFAGGRVRRPTRSFYSEVRC